jgi:hypothetical protein
MVLVGWGMKLTELGKQLMVHNMCRNYQYVLQS